MDDLRRVGGADEGAKSEKGWANATLPPEAPIDMAEQSLREAVGRIDRLPTSPGAVGLRRAVLLLCTIGLTAGAAYQMYLVVTINGPTALQVLVLALYAGLFAWIAFSFATALAGFFSIASGVNRQLGIDPASPMPDLSSRCALLVPTYNEAPVRLMARIQAIHESVVATAQLTQFDIFILSDTTDPGIWIAEESHFFKLRECIGPGAHIFYRHRTSNEGRKAGNIAEWVRRFGGRYETMIVLDADSLMTGDTIVRLVGAMERHQSVALIQTLPLVINGSTLFARLQQFAGRVYGPVLAHGLAWWHGAEGNYWGHNAVIRVRAFAQSAGLPPLPGRKPFGGTIMSHDFVEAALMRRHGWAVHMAPALSGSFEESPPALADYAERDRRWCQGNLQHIAVLPARGLHWVSRLHLLTGIGAYLTAPMWMAFLLVGMLISLQAQFIRPEYFPSGFSLFPQWPTEDPVRAAWVFAGTMGLLLAPKLLGFLVMVTNGVERRGCGGALRAFAAMLLETALSGLIAPIMMWTQSVAVVQILSGQDSGWNAQRRDNGPIPRDLVLRRYAWPTVAGLALAAAAYVVSLPLMLWMSPVILGLLLAVPLAALTSSPTVGRALRRIGMLQIPEECHPPGVVTRANELEAANEARTAVPTSPVLVLLNDAVLLAAHREMLPERRRSRGEVDVDLVVAMAKLDQSEDLQDALAYLTKQEMRALLADRIGLDRLLALPNDARGRAA